MAIIYPWIPWKSVLWPIPLQNFEQLWNRPKNKRWRRCCTTGTCSMRQSHSIHCNSRGCDLISFVTSHCSLETSCSSSEMSQSRSEIATRHLQRLQRLWDCHIVLLHEVCDCCTAVRQTENFRHKRRALCANPLLKIIHNPGYVHFRTVLIL